MDERAIFQTDIKPTYGFIDYPEWGFDINREDALYVVDMHKMTGYHACKYSVVWGDVPADFVDDLQREGDLPEGKYIVCYYELDNNCDLLELAEIGVTKAEIIENVRNQKYREGADYFLMEESAEENHFKKTMERIKEALQFDNSFPVIIEHHGADDFAVYFPETDYSERGSKAEILKTLSEAMKEE